MKISDNSKIFPLLFLFIVNAYAAFSQPCTTLGQTPSTAFPVCGITTFQQNTVPICSTNDLFVPGCSGTGGALYQNKNPFFYKFTCYTSGTLGFLITPNAADEDYDWQLYDITGRNPNDIFINNNLVVAGNWSGTYGPTGASATGKPPPINCASVPADNEPTFAQMPSLIAGHEYLLMISHFTNTQSGYALSFGGGTAVITNPSKPHLASAKPDCAGQSITLKLNKKVNCTSFTASGSEFSITPAVTTVVSANTDSCAFGFDFDEVTLTLASSLTNGNYQLVINNGSDGNTYLDNCDNPIPAGEQISFIYAAPQPILADSIAKVACSPDSVSIYFPKKINCSSISADGSDFVVNGPTSVTVASAGGNCINGKTDYVVVKFTAPIYTQGIYQLTLKTGSDGTILIDECGQETPLQTLPFTTVDTVSALFQYSIIPGCRFNTVSFFHDGAHNVNSWNWLFNNGTPVTTQTHTIKFPATSTNTVLLNVSNGVCSDTASNTLVMNNEVIASFDMTDFICPEDKLEVMNNSKGQIDSWQWTYDILGNSTLKDPPPFLFPTINREAYYTVRLKVSNNTLNCSDSARKTVLVLDHCFIDVPTAFTPNNDGLNDYFRPHNALKADNYEFKVYNRWGQLVFQSRNWRDKWDGKINGVVQNSGVYVWMLRYINRDTKKEVFQKGTVMLIR